jgi:hypothetical protein
MAAHEAFWAAAQKTDGDAGGARALIDVLLLHRSMATEDVVAGTTAALTVGAVTADVSSQSRRAATRRWVGPGWTVTPPILLAGRSDELSVLPSAGWRTRPQ